MQSVYEYLSPSIPNDHCRQTRAIDMALGRLKKLKPGIIMDLGCGTGVTYDVFKQHAPKARWIGVDIEESPEVKQRQRKDAEFVTFDGINIPFDDDYFDMIFSNQVFEHVRHPEALLAEVRRTLSKRGLFIGQTSHLEPYHSYSYWNFTAFGFKRICEDAGLKLVELRPGIDGITLIKRSYLGRPDEYSRWFKEESPLNIEIEENARRQFRRTKIINFRKLMYCGQFAFVVARA